MRQTLDELSYGIVVLSRKGRPLADERAGRARRSSWSAEDAASSCA